MPIRKKIFVLGYRSQEQATLEKGCDYWGEPDTIKEAQELAKRILTDEYHQHVCEGLGTPLAYSQIKIITGPSYDRTTVIHSDYFKKETKTKGKQCQQS